MIIAFDGNVYTGKTTIINSLRKNNGFIKIDEHSFFVDGIKENDNYIDIQQRYLDVDKIRRMKINDNNVNLLDRSFVSVSAHVYAIYRLGIADIRGAYINLIKNNFNQLVIPSQFIFVTCGYSKILERCQLVNNDKFTEEIYLMREYCHWISDFNKRWIERVDGEIIETGSGSLDTICEMIRGNIYNKNINFKKNFIINNIKDCYH